MSDKGMDALELDGSHIRLLDFKNSNVRDDDLDAFIPAFNGYVNPFTIKVIRLNGSKVSPEAVQRFREAVPGCEIEL
jgi:hypothetical protein